VVLAKLSTSSIHKANTEKLDFLNDAEGRIKFRRSDDLKSIHSLPSPMKSEPCLQPVTYLHSVHDVNPIYIVLENEVVGGDLCICGASLYSLGYSSRKGRVMNFD
jgi:hypothetical protein